ncbi:cupin domain-containing protein [Streptomyces sp. NPDC092296]|uniref:cupin domain-containing protein n=1 Tax=Streptomyces sp. NPDC092296 TaxID=3366012 RepID=UPI00380FE2AB
MPAAADGRISATGPRALCDIAALAAGADEAAAGALWRLAESGRQLDANLVRLPPGHRVGTHTEPDLDVLLLVVSGGGTLTGGGEEQRLAPGGLLWLPHGSTRDLAAGPDGLAYLTVHPRRPGMRIRSAPPGPGPGA